MKKNALWSVLLVNLLGLALLMGYIALNPAETKAYGLNPFGRLMELGEQEFVRMMEEEHGEDWQGGTFTVRRSVFEVADSETASPPSREQVEGRPPPRRTTADEQPAPAVVEARYMGPLRDRLGVAPPPEDFYPFRVERRTFPNEDEIEVEIIVMNRSGRIWRNATVILGAESRAHPPQVFEVDSWRMDGRARLRYRFPREELETRLRNLRVLVVRGEAITSPLLESTRQPREIDTTAQANEQTPEWDQQVTISFEGTEEVPANLDLPSDTDGSHSELLEGVESAHGHALEIQERLIRMALMINEHGAGPALASEPFAEEATALLEARDAFDALVIGLNVRLARSQDPGVQALRPALETMGEALFERINAFERQVRAGVGDFSIEGLRAE